MFVTSENQVSSIMVNISELDDCDRHLPPSSKVMLLVGYSLLLPLGVLLNGVSLFVFLYLLRPLSVVGIFLCNLALSDLLFSLSLPLRIYYYAHHRWPFGVFLCRLSGSIFQINMYGSCLFLLCINLDRYLAVVYPLRFRHLRRPKVAYLTCLSVWLLIVTGSVPAALVHSSSDCWNGKEQVARCFEGLDSWQGRVFPLLLVAEVVGFLLPLGGVLYGSCRVFWELCYAQEDGWYRHSKTIKLIVLNLGIFLFCFVPYNTTLVVYGLQRAELVPESGNSLPAIKKTLSITVLLASTNCALDPMVYYFSTEGFRKTLRRLGRHSKVKEKPSKTNNRKRKPPKRSENKGEPVITTKVNQIYNINTGMYRLPNENTQYVDRVERTTSSHGVTTKNVDLKKKRPEVKEEAKNGKEMKRLILHQRTIEESSI